MSPAREVELKLEVPAHSFYRLARSSLLRAARKKSSKPATLVSVYFDTDKLKLRNKGLSLRVRRIGTQTSAGAAQGRAIVVLQSIRTAHEADEKIIRRRWSLETPTRLRAALHRHRADIEPR